MFAFVVGLGVFLDMKMSMLKYHRRTGGLKTESEVGERGHAETQTSA
jgi:hypothetical protein